MGIRLLPSQRPQVQHPHPCPGQPRGWGLSAAGAGAAALPAAPTACPACPACPTCAQRRRSRPPVPRAPRRPRPRRSAGTAGGAHGAGRGFPPLRPPRPRPARPETEGVLPAGGVGPVGTRRTAALGYKTNRQWHLGLGWSGSSQWNLPSPRNPGLGFLLCTRGQFVRPTLDGAGEGRVTRTK